MITRRAILQTLGFGGLFSFIPASLLLSKDDRIESFEVDKDFPVNELPEISIYESKYIRYVIFPIECVFIVKYKNNPCYYTFAGWNILDKQDWDYIKQNDIRFRQEWKECEYITNDDVRRELAKLNCNHEISEVKIKDKNLKLISIWIPSE